MNVLITGGAGFIGSHLAERLIPAGHGVTVIDDLSTGSRENLAAIADHGEFHFVAGSIRDEQVMAGLIERCDVIFHLAAAVGVQLIVERPVHTIETNIHGSEVVLELASRYRRRVLLASSSEVYGKNTKVPFGEDDDTILGSTRFSRWSYACSKMIDEFLALAYHRQEGLEAIVCRFFNTIGPRQTGQYGMVVPRFVRRALRAEPIEIYGTGRQIRCFCSVADVVEALTKLIVSDEAIGQVINIGSDEPVTINRLAEMVIRQTDSSSAVVHRTYEDVYGRAFDDLMIRQPDLAKIQRLIGYRPNSTLEDTLQEIIVAERQRLRSVDRKE